MNKVIPRVVHVTWPSTDVIYNQSPVILNGLKNIHDMNPRWRIEISVDQDVDQYLKHNISQQDFALIQHRPFVERSDLWRLIKMYNEGGMYIDIDRYYNQPLDTVLASDTHMVLPTNGDFDFSQDIMISAPQHEIFWRALHYNMNLRRNGETNIYRLGAQAYMHAVTSWILDDGLFVNTDPGAEKFDEIRALLKRHPNIVTYRENLPMDTVCFRYDADTWQPGNGKDKAKLYAEYGIRHWTTVS